jgi:hypothetical protein
MADHYYWDEVRKNIADIRAWLSEVESKLNRFEAVRQAAPPAASIDESIGEATSATRIQKALEREFGIDRRTVLQRAERLVKAYGLDKDFPDWSTDVDFWRKLAERSPDGQTRLARGLAALGAGR